VVACWQNFLEEGVSRPYWLREEQLRRPETGYGPPALLVRRSILDRVGPFDPSFRIGEDLDWFARAMDAGIRMAVLPEVLVRRRIHGSNLCHEDYRVRLQVQARILKASIERKRGAGGEGGQECGLRTVEC
jgi:hypothetical protein